MTEQSATGSEPDPEREGPTGLERPVFFSDAVVAIAITWSRCPWSTMRGICTAAAVGTSSAGTRPTLIAAGISFAVIAAFWMEHHQLFDRATNGVPRPLGVNMMWLAGIMALPVATVVQVDGRRDRSAPRRGLSNG